MTTDEPPASADLSTNTGRPPTAQELTAIDRVLALTDQAQGLQAELAETQYRHDEFVRAAEARRADEARRRDEVEQQLRQQLRQLEEHLSELQQLVRETDERAAEASQRLAEVLSSRSWRITQRASRLVTRRP